MDESVRIWGPGSLKTSFKGFNKNDPFKAQCGKLELPELSRMRLNRGVSPVYSSNAQHEENLILPVTRNSSEEEKSSSNNRSGYKNSNSLSNSSQSASNSSTMASANNNVLSSSEEGHSDNGSSFNDNENETSVEEENANGSTNSNRKVVASVKQQLLSDPVPVISNTNITANNPKKITKENSDSSHNSDSNEEGYTGSDSFGTSSNNNKNTGSSGSSNDSINKMKKSGSNKSLNALVATNNSTKENNTEITSGSNTCDQSNSNHDFSSSSNNSDKNSDNEMDVVGLGGIFWEDRQNNCHEKVPVKTEKDIAPTSSSESKRISLSVYRKALKKAVEGHPMDADEALALEEIVAENQKLSKFSKLIFTLKNK